MTTARAPGRKRRISARVSADRACTASRRHGPVEPRGEGRQLGELRGGRDTAGVEADLRARRLRRRRSTRFPEYRARHEDHQGGTKDTNPTLLASFVSVSSCASCNQLAQHVGEDAAVEKAVSSSGRVDADRRRTKSRRRPSSPCHRRPPTAAPDRARALDVEELAAGEPGGRRIAIGELQRQHAHVDQVAAVDALEALGDDRLDAGSIVPLAAQSRDEPEPYSLPASTMSGTPASW